LNTIDQRMERAARLLDQVESSLKQFGPEGQALSAAALEKQIEPMLEQVEQAQQLLFDEQEEMEEEAPDPEELLVTEGDAQMPEEAQPDSMMESGGGVGGLVPGRQSMAGPSALDAAGAKPSEEESEEEPMDPEAKAEMEKGSALIQRSRRLEAAIYEVAARRLAPGIKDGEAATEEQEKHLASAVSALEAHFMLEPDPMLLVKIAELEVLRREVKKAKVFLGKVLELDPDGEAGKAAQVMLEKINSDPRIKDKGRCFIATAAMGSADSSEVKTLRSFRDKVLMKNRAGRLLVAAYYEVSPPVARLLERNEALRTATSRYLIQPLATAARKVPGVEN
jgi:hypothetical protein